MRWQTRFAEQPTRLSNRTGKSACATQMQIREYKDSDFAALRALHAAQGFDYSFPDLRNPLFLTKLVLTDDSDGIRIAPGFSSGFGSPVDSTGVRKPDPASSSASSPDQTPAALIGGATKETRVATQTGAGNCRVEQASACSPGMERASPSPILGAALLRLTAEAYLLLDPRAGTPRERWQWLLALHAAAERDAWRRGLEDVHAWLPPSIAQKFGRRISQLGWRRDDAWTPYSKRLFQ